VQKTSASFALNFRPANLFSYITTSVDASVIPTIMADL